MLKVKRSKNDAAKIATDARENAHLVLKIYLQRGLCRTLPLQLPEKELTGFWI